MNDLAATCDETIEKETKSVTTNFNEEMASAKQKCSKF